MTVRRDITGGIKNAVNLARNFGAAAATHVASGMRHATPEVQAARQATCNLCPSYDPKGWNGVGKCKSCGCRLPSKINWATSRCPLNKWPA